MAHFHMHHFLRHAVVPRQNIFNQKTRKDKQNKTNKQTYTPTNKQTKNAEKLIKTENTHTHTHTHTPHTPIPTHTHKHTQMMNK